MHVDKLHDYHGKKMVRLGLKTAADLRILEDFFKPEVLILRP